MAQCAESLYILYCQCARTGSISHASSPGCAAPHRHAAYLAMPLLPSLALTKMRLLQPSVQLNSKWQSGSIGWSVGVLFGYAQDANQTHGITCIDAGRYKVTAQDMPIMCWNFEHTGGNWELSVHKVISYHSVQEFRHERFLEEAKHDEAIGRDFRFLDIPMLISFLVASGGTNIAHVLKEGCYRSVP
jgi:hypothetical protein